MFQRLKLLHEAWKLTKMLDAPAPTLHAEKEGELTMDELKKMLDVDIPLGDGKAEFFGEGTQEEFKEMQEEDKGFKGIFGLGR